MMTRAALLVHGLTATPATMAPTIEALEEAGYHVMAPMLPGHGTCVEELIHTPASAWVNAVHAAYEKLAAQYDDIYYVGLSLGGLLGLELAESHPTQLRAMALLAPALEFMPSVQRLVPIVKYTPLRWLYRTTAKDWRHSVADPEGLQVYQASSYARFPVPSVLALADLQKQVLPKLREIHVPTLLVHSRQDQVVPPSATELLAATLHDPKPKVLWLEKSYHVITLDHDRDRVNQAILEFFKVSL